MKWKIPLTVLLVLLAHVSFALEIEIQEAEKKLFDCQLKGKESKRISIGGGPVEASYVFKGKPLYTAESNNDAFLNDDFRNCKSFKGLARLIKGPIKFKDQLNPSSSPFFSDSHDISIGYDTSKSILLDPKEMKCEFEWMSRASTSSFSTVTIFYKGVQVGAFLGNSAETKEKTCKRILKEAIKNNRPIEIHPNSHIWNVSSNSIESFMSVSQQNLAQGVALNDNNERSATEEAMFGISKALNSIAKKIDPEDNTNNGQRKAKPLFETASPFKKETSTIGR